ncbi:MAG: hypothetical protein AABX96_03890 [Nanoarchaeota archaeon]
MVIFIDRYSDSKQAEIRLELPQGECFIHASRHFSNVFGEDRYDVSVIVPWYGNLFYTRVDGLVIYEDIDIESWQAIMNSSNSDLIAIIRKALPTIKQANRDIDLEI